MVIFRGSGGSLAAGLERIAESGERPVDRTGGPRDEEEFAIAS